MAGEWRLGIEETIRRLRRAIRQIKGGKPRDPITPPPPPPTYTLTVTAVNCDVTGPGIDTAAADTTQTYPENTSVPLTAVADSGYVFSAWSGASTSENSSITLTMSADRSVTATAAAEPVGEPSPIPGTGAVLRQDLATALDPTPLWKKVESAYSSGPWVSSDVQVTRLSTNPDTRVPVGQVSPPANYRRLKTTQNVQSIYDDGVNNSSKRTQLISNSDITTFYPLAYNTPYIIYFGIRFNATAQPPSDQQSANTQVWQIKNTKPGEPLMVLSLNESATKLRLIRTPNAVHFGEWTVPRNHNTDTNGFVHLAFYYKAHLTSGQMRLWGELTGDPDADYVPMTNLITTKTASYTGAIGKLSTGPYEPLSQAGTTRDYSHVQVCAFTP